MERTGRVAARRAQRAAVAVTVALAVASALLAPARPAGAGDDLGREGASYAGAYLDPSGSKPQSKLWHHDGSWWGVLFATASQSFRIHRLDRGTGAWLDTGTTIDTRVNSRADALWDGSKLYVASHRYSKSTEAGYPARLYRLTYDAASRRFLHDPGFPTQINNMKTESLVIDKDGTGRLWATWVQAGRVFLNRTVDGRTTWGTPFALPVATPVSSDDISSIVSFGGTRIGVVWGNQLEGSYQFSIHHDSDPDTTWQPVEKILPGPNDADDHVNLKADSAGNLYAALKTSRTAAAEPLIVLAVRPAAGGWTTSTVATKRDSHTRPIVVLDEEHRQVHVLMTGPGAGRTDGQSGGDIYLKSASMDAPVFGDGYGTPVVRDGDNATMNNATSTKQLVSSATGFVALATTEATDRYWHADLALGGAPPPPPPPPPPAGATVTVRPSADAYVRSGSPTSVYGLSTFFRAEQQSAGDTYRSYLTFTVPELSGTITKATVRLYVVNASVAGGSLHRTSGAWAERQLSWSNAPAFEATPLTTVGAAPLNAWVEFDVTAAVRSGSEAAFALVSSSGDSVHYSSREGANPPQLVVTAG